MLLLISPHVGLYWVMQPRPPATNVLIPRAVAAQVFTDKLGGRFEDSEELRRREVARRHPSVARDVRLNIREARAEERAVGCHGYAGAPACIPEHSGQPEPGAVVK